MIDKHCLYLHFPEDLDKDKRLGQRVYVLSDERIGCVVKLWKWPDNHDVLFIDYPDKTGIGTSMENLSFD